MHFTRILVVGVALASVGCDYHVDTQSRMLSESISYGDANDQERIKKALSNAGIPYRVVVRERAQEFVEWDAQYSSQVERIKESLFLPSGRNLRMDAERQSRFKAWLNSNGVPYRTMTEQDGEYIVWEEADAERVRSWEEFPPYYDNPPVSAP